MESAKVIFSETDLTFSPTKPTTGISGVMGITGRGPLNKPDILIKSWPEFERLYGPLSPTNDFPLLCKRALDRGAQLRVNSIKHNDFAFAQAAFTREFTLSAALVAGQNITVAIAAAGSVGPIAFVTDSPTTLLAVVNAIKAAFPALLSAYIINATGTSLSLTGNGVNLGALTVTPGGTSAPTATLHSATGPIDSFAGAHPLFTLTPKYPGADYNNIYYTISNASNGNANYFDLTIRFKGNDALTETYRNLTIVGSPAIVDSHYLDAVSNGSSLVNVTYFDLSALVGQINPLRNNFNLYGGSNGGTVTINDYTGDQSTKTGLYAFDSIDDMMQFAALDREDAPFHITASGYAFNRKDLMYWGHLSNTYISENQLVTAKDAMNIDSSFSEFFAGGVIVVDPFTGQNKNISELGDILGIAAYSDSTAGEWYSFAGPQRGIITNALGIVNNFGARSNTAGLDLLANHQINVVINRSNKLMLWGNFTSQFSTSKLSYSNVRRGNIYLRKLLGPFLENFLEDPCDIPTWKNIYLAVKPVLDDLKSKRMFYDYAWQGDQFANTLDDLVINQRVDVDQGKYKVRLFVKDIVSLQVIAMDITLSPSDVSFEDVLELINP